jgi:purine nucleosidase
LTAPLSVVIDTDTAADDAVALLMAVRNPGVMVRAITVVAGNVPVDLGTRNALITLEMAAVNDVPVFVGCQRPLTRTLETAQYYHGEDGMRGADLKEPVTRPEPMHAVEALLRIARNEPGRHCLVTMAPLTNVATALTIDPSLLTRFNDTYMMVGAPDAVGNVSATGEFNAWADPEAAQIVFGAPGRKTMVGWDVCRKYALITPADDARLRDLGTLGQFASDINRDVPEVATGLAASPGYGLWDPMAMAIALDWGIVDEHEDLHVSVSTDASTRGQTFVDRRDTAPTPNTRVVTKASPTRFKEQLFTRLAGGPTID